MAILSGAAFCKEAPMIPFHLQQGKGGKALSPSELNMQVEELLFQETNSQRARQKLPPLSSNVTLIKVAHDHSQDMLKRNYLSHFSPEGKSVLDRTQKYAGKVQSNLGENLHTIYSSEGLTDPQAIVHQMMEDWMHSSSHKKNIVGKNFTQLGVGCASDGERIYCTQVFAGGNL